MSVAGIHKAWALLLALSLATTVLSMAGSTAVTGGIVLALCGLKARTILSIYLELQHSAFWMRVFDLVIGLFLAAAFVLYLAGLGHVP